MVGEDEVHGATLEHVDAEFLSAIDGVVVVAAGQDDAGWAAGSDVFSQAGESVRVFEADELGALVHFHHVEAEAVAIHIR